MRVERLSATRDAAEHLRALVPAAASVSADVAAILAAIRAGGDQALRSAAERYDGLTGPLRVPGAELEQALAALDPAVRAGLEVARRNVRAVAEAGLDEDRGVVLPQGQTVTLREVPVQRAGVYVPGGRAAYPSSVVMAVETARAAGVADIVVATPGGHPVILAACALCGVEQVIRAGGAHAIGALAYGTESIARADVIAGPGGLWVQEAKRQVSSVHCGIDGFNGPTDLVVVAGADAPALWVVSDLLAQGEHGEGTLVVLVSDDRGLLEAAAHPLGEADYAALAAVVHAEDMEAALAFTEALAPEHLQLVGQGAEALAPRVTRAGCLFVGAYAGTAYGDYVAGSNHTLPTEGAARFASGLNVRHFRRRMAEVRLSPAAAAALAPHGAAIARAESFAAHASSMEVRENPPR